MNCRAHDHDTLIALSIGAHQVAHQGVAHQSDGVAHQGGSLIVSFDMYQHYLSRG